THCSSALVLCERLSRQDHRHTHTRTHTHIHRQYHTQTHTQTVPHTHTHSPPVFSWLDYAGRHLRQYMPNPLEMPSACFHYWLGLKPEAQTSYCLGTA